MRYAPVAMCLMALFVGSTAFGGANPDFTLPLHAKVSISCTSGQANCTTVLPTVNVNGAPGDPWSIFLLINNFANVAGVQTAVVWENDWDLDGQPTGCRGAGQVFGVTPDDLSPNGGPVLGAIATAFNCLNSTGVAGAIARLDFLQGSSGCVRQVEPGFPFGTHAVDCSNLVDRLPVGNPAPHDLRLGKICVGQGGRDACPVVTPVEPVTWGKIKASYK